MPRTWSNARSTDTRSAAQRIHNRPSNLTTFLIFLSVIVVFFVGLMTYATIHVLMHPSKEQVNAQTRQPDGDH